MATEQPSPEVSLLRYLRARGYAIERADGPGDYVVTHFRDDPMPFRPRLSLREDLLIEYLNELERKPEALAGLTPLSITESHLEAALSAGEMGPNHTVAVGVRDTKRDGVQFFWERADSPPSNCDNTATTDLEWRADRPNQ